jgi:hypothetical protein
MRFYCFFYILIYDNNYQKGFFLFFPNFDRNIPKMIFGHMSCAGRYNLVLDGANLVGVGSKSEMSN